MNFNKKNWKVSKYETWLNINDKNINQFNFSITTINSFQNGFPEAAAPFLSFNNENKFLKLENANDYLMDDNVSLNRKICFGFDGAGNPICIDENEQIILLDHENEYKETLINSSLENFQNSLLTYRELIYKVNMELGAGSFFDFKYSYVDIDNLKEDLSIIDNVAMLSENSFWNLEIKNLIANKNAYS